MRCDETGAYGTGCARIAGHAGAHWLTGNPEAARAALDREGIEKLPEWRRRALEQAAGKPLTAVKDLTGLS